MSKKFEQLLDLVVNENMEQANELFHEIVVEMSKEIYENMISQDQNVDDMDEGMHMDDMEEGMDDMEEGMHMDDMEEGMDDMDETMYDMEEARGGDPADQFVDQAEDNGLDVNMMDNQDQDSQMIEIKNDLEDIKDQIARILDMEKDEPEHAEEFGSDEYDQEEDESEEDEEDEEDAKKYAMEQRRLTREYREKVSHPSNAEEGSVNKNSVVSKATGRPSSTANGKGILQGGEETGKGGMGVLKKGGEFVPGGTQNVGSTKTKGYTNRVSTPSNKADHEKSLLGK